MTLGGATISPAASARGAACSRQFFLRSAAGQVARVFSTSPLFLYIVRSSPVTQEPHQAHMLTPKLGPQALLPQAWIPKSPAHVPSRPIAQTRLSVLDSHKQYAKRFIIKRRYFDTTYSTKRNVPKARNPRSMLAATAAVVGSAAAAGYSTSADARESDVQVSQQQAFVPQLESAAFQIPHPEKQAKGGEDTYLVSSNGLVVGVFDGVGGWAESGVDPRDYALKLSQGAQEATDAKGMTSPLEVMRHAARYAHRTVGSATACIVGMEGSNLISANLGDSGFMIVRLSADSKRVDLLFKSEEQQHSFNFPFQLGAQSRDRPDDAELLSFPVQHGDLVILGTDGLFDNIDAKRICKIIETAIAVADESKLTLSTLARFIAADAFRTSQDPNAITPFTIGSRYRYRGGKPDDITVVVSRVLTSAPSSSSSTTTSRNTSTSTSSKSIGSASQTNKFSTSTSSSSLDTATTTNESSARNMIANTSASHMDEEVGAEIAPASPSLLARLWGLRPWGAAFARL